MTGKEKYESCKYACSRAYCPHYETDAMRNACANVPEYHGGAYPLMPETDWEAVFGLCDGCENYKPQKTGL